MRRGSAGVPGRRGARALVCAVAVVCAIGAQGVAAPGAYADPGARESGRGSGSGSRHGSGKPGLEEVRERIEGLYHKAEKATDDYNAAKERVARQEREVAKLTKSIGGTRKKINDLKRQAGSLASAQYRSGGMPSEARLMLNADPESFLDNVTLARTGHHAARRVMTQLARAERALRADERDATRRWKKLEKDREKKAAAKKEITEKITSAEKLESELAADERERLRKLEDDQAYRNQLKWLDSGVLREIGKTASGKGKKAISYATSQIGKDYVWGAEGPDTFDCSGLTMRAWEAAGRPIPRTSQEQWKELPHIRIQNMRPGDLIIYHRDASHVGMYIGNGAIVHAPRPGRRVTVEGAGSMRILGVVRPDAGPPVRRAVWRDLPVS